MVGESAGRNVEEMEEDDEVEAQHQPAPQWSPFESLMIQKMDDMLHLHQEHSTKVHSPLENITSRLENIETRLTLSNLLTPDEDEAQLYFKCLFLLFDFPFYLFLILPLFLQSFIMLFD